MESMKKLLNNGSLIAKKAFRLIASIVKRFEFDSI